MENNDRSGPFWDLIEGRAPCPQLLGCWGGNFSRLIQLKEQ